MKFIDRIINAIFERIAARIVAAEISGGPNETTPQPTTMTIVRMRPDVLERLEKELMVPYVGSTTTEIQAGYLLGQQSVLAKLRAGYAID